MEKEACLVARARAHLLLALADCNTMSIATAENTTSGSTRSRASDVVRRVRDGADHLMGEILQVRT